MFLGSGKINSNKNLGEWSKILVFISSLFPLCQGLVWKKNQKKTKQTKPLRNTFLKI